MTHPIDRIIQAMFKKNADRLQFATAKQVTIRVEGEEKVILDQQVKTEQIDKLFQPILSVEQLEQFLQEGQSELSYDSPNGRVGITSRRKGDQLRVMVTPASAADAPMELQMSDGPAPGRGSAAPAPRGNSMGESGLRNMRLADSASGMNVQLAEGSPVPELAPAPRGPSRVAHAETIEKGSDGANGSISWTPRGTPGGEPGINKILRDLVKLGGSDLHLTTGQKPKMRKDGDIMEIPGWNEVLTNDLIRDWMFEVGHNRSREQFTKEHDTDYGHEIAGCARFRMNMFMDRNGAGAVMRQIPSKVLTADQLNLPPVIRGFCGLPKGLVLVTGPTGSGKSTTLAAMIDLINKSRADHIITIEDPVEFVHQSIKCLINQREVHSHTESFARALRAALREDPDIVLVGEMRDLETVHIAIETAETGHLVFGTLHTNTAASTVDRVIDQFPTDHQAQIRVMLSECLKGVVAQTLCKKIGGGRVACLEILVCNSAIGNLIREGKVFQIASIMQTGKSLGMQTQIDAMMALVNSKTIAPGEAYFKAIDQNLMKAALERAGHKVEGEK
jgi:twitching motility protein PilT